MNETKCGRQNNPIVGERTEKEQPVVVIRGGETKGQLIFYCNSYRRNEGDSLTKQSGLTMPKITYQTNGLRWLGK